MNKESKDYLVKMFSLMGRMDEHMTLSEAKYSEKQMINEGMYEDNGQTQFKSDGLIHPRANVDVYVDHNKNIKKTRVTIAPLLLQDANRVASKYASNGANFFTYEKNGRKNAGIYIDVNGTSLYAPNKRETSSEENVDTSNGNENDDLFGGVFDTDNSSTNSNNEDDDIFAGVFESIIKEDEDGTIDTNATNDTEGQAPRKRILKDKKMEQWFSTVYMNIASDIAKNTSAYNKIALTNLQDWQTLYQAFLDKEYIDANFTEHQSADAITKAVLNALRNGSYAPIMSALPVMNLQSMLFGKILSARNITLALNQANGRAVQPTKLLGRTRWEKNFNRKVKDDAEPYIQLRPNAAYRGNNNVQGLKGHANRFGVQYNNKYTPFLSYDISDTEDIDPNNPYDENSESNMVNNLNGTLNQLAQDELNNRQQDIENNLSEEDKALIEAVKTDDGRAKCYNEALLSFFKNEGYEGKCQVTFIPVNTVDEYIQNVINFCKGLVSKLPVNKEENKLPIIAIQAFAICYFTQCPNDIFQQMCRRNGIGINADRTAQESDIQQLIGPLEDCINYIYNYWEKKFGTLRPENGLPDEDEDDSSMAMVNVSECKIYRKRETLEQLLESLR